MASATASAASACIRPIGPIRRIGRVPRFFIFISPLCGRRTAVDYTQLQGIGAVPFVLVHAINDVDSRVRGLRQPVAEAERDGRSEEHTSEIQSRLPLV